MRELKSSRWIVAKGLLFLMLGLLCAVLLAVEYRSLRSAALLVVAIWCFCRFYYFAFYVIERYVDPSYRFSGLVSFARYVFQRRR
ncbi:MAG TPA: hypothetical protein VN087_21875 [Verrucomicrobiae bacterium]|jgi:hypothetical protein|nr:hypothetical protein [Verrucomicrobiae bacterium]